jgi:hypothetical protein
VGAAAEVVVVSDDGAREVVAVGAAVDEEVLG